MQKKAIEDKREREIRVVTQMIQIYCRGRHKSRRGELCPLCQTLAEYAAQRVQRCPFMETKTFCSNCKVHCYRAAEREQIRAVMRYSGPRMLLFHPVMAVRHGIESQKERKKQS